MRRLPVYLLVDTSGSMKGEPIEAVNTGLQMLVSSLRRDPQALETAYLSIITFDREARLVLPLTPVAELQLPLIETPDCGPTMTGAALELVCQRVDTEVRTQSTDIRGLEASSYHDGRLQVTFRNTTKWCPRKTEVCRQRPVRRNESQN